MAFAATGLICSVTASGSAPNWWVYTSTDAHGTVEGSLYFAGMKTYGMKVGDVVVVIDSDTGPGNATIHSVTVATDVGCTINAALLA